MTLTKLFTQIANAIREKKGTVGTIIASNFPNEILEIGGGGFPPDWTEIGYEEAPIGVMDDFNYAKDIKDNWDSSITTMYQKYQSDLKLVTFPLVDTSNVTSLNQAFYSCTSLKSFPLLDTSNVANLQNAFSSCINLTQIPLFNTEKVTNMVSTFYNCSRLKTIPLLNTSNVTSMSSTFNLCSSLESVPLFNTSKVTNFSNCFAGCVKLKDVPVFDMSSIGSLGHSQMFSNCSALTDESLNNILEMLTNVISRLSSSYRTLRYAGFSSNEYPASRIEALSNYQAFVNAGGSIGY